MRALAEHDLDAQLNFIRADLASVDRSVTPWVVVFGHKPLYCSTDDYYDCKIGGPKVRDAQTLVQCATRRVSAMAYMAAMPKL